MPPKRIETERLVLRCWEPTDAPRLKEALDVSIDHLHPWVPWAIPVPYDTELVQARIEKLRDDFASGVHYVFGVFDRDETEALGGAGLYGRIGPEALEIGYWIRADRVRRGFASEAATALMVAGFAEPGVRRLEMHIDPRNAASLGIPAKLGFRHRETLIGSKTTPGGEPADTMIFELAAEDYSDGLEHGHLRRHGGRE